MAVVVKEEKSGTPNIVYEVVMMNTSCMKGAPQNETNVKDVTYQRGSIVPVWALAPWWRAAPTLAGSTPPRRTQRCPLACSRWIALIR